MTALAKSLTDTRMPEFLPVDTLLTAVGKELEIAAYRKKQSHFWIIAITVAILIIVMGTGVAIFCYLKRNSTTSLIYIVSEKVDRLIGDDKDQEGKVVKDIKYEELLGQINQLKEIIEGFQQKQRQDTLRRIIRREGAKMLAVTQSNDPSLLAQRPMPPAVPMPTGILNENYQGPVPAIQEQGYVAPYEKRTLFSTAPMGGFSTPPITYRRYH